MITTAHILCLIVGLTLGFIIGRFILLYKYRKENRRLNTVLKNAINLIEEVRTDLSKYRKGKK